MLWFKLGKMGSEGEVLQVFFAFLVYWIVYKNEIYGRDAQGSVQVE